MTKKRIAILGSTGSIGTQALDVVRECPGMFEVELLTAGNNADLLLKQALEFKPNAVVIANENHFTKLNDILFDEGIKVYAGSQALEDAVQMEGIDIVLTAMVGAAGLKPTIAAIKAKKHIALANKETLVVAGEIISQLAIENGVSINPVDSEHSAIFQCLTGEHINPIEKIVLTASGGPFRGFSREQLEKVSREQALKHPNWSMGAKITIDSASMMNKGLEVIEAKWLFGLQNDQIDVIVHPQSIIHSLVQFEDGSMKAQLGLPDMKLPILYAMSFPTRPKTSWERFNFLDYPNLTFEQVDMEVFRNLQFAFDSLQKGGNMPCILNAANEIAVDAFLKDKVSFLGMSDMIEKTMNQSSFINKPNLEDLFLSDEEARRIAQQFVK